MFDNNFLRTIGLADLPQHQRESLLGQINKELELRVGGRLTEGMTPSKITELERLILADKQGAFKWITSNRPSYKKIVTEEARAIKQELLANRSRILEGAV